MSGEGLDFFTELLGAIGKKDEKLQEQRDAFVKDRRWLYFYVITEMVLNALLLGAGTYAFLDTFGASGAWLYAGSAVIGLGSSGLVSLEPLIAITEKGEVETAEQEGKERRRKKAKDIAKGGVCAAAAAMPLAMSVLGNVAKPFSPFTLFNTWLLHMGVNATVAASIVSASSLIIGVVFTAAVVTAQYFLEKKAEQYLAKIKQHKKDQKARLQVEFLFELANENLEYQDRKYLTAAEQGRLFKEYPEILAIETPEAGKSIMYSSVVTVPEQVLLQRAVLRRCAEQYGEGKYWKEEYRKAAERGALFSDFPDLRKTPEVQWAVLFLLYRNYPIVEYDTELKEKYSAAARVGDLFEKHPEILQRFNCSADDIQKQQKKRFQYYRLDDIELGLLNGAERMDRASRKKEAEQLISSQGRALFACKVVAFITIVVLAVGIGAFIFTATYGAGAPVAVVATLAILGGAASALGMGKLFFTSYSDALFNRTRELSEKASKHYSILPEKESIGLDITSQVPKSPSRLMRILTSPLVTATLVGVAVLMAAPILSLIFGPVAGPIIAGVLAVTAFIIVFAATTYIQRRNQQLQQLVVAGRNDKDKAVRRQVQQKIRKGDEAGKEVKPKSATKLGPPSEPEPPSTAAAAVSQMKPLLQPPSPFSTSATLASAKDELARIFTSDTISQLGLTEIWQDPFSTVKTLSELQSVLINLGNLITDNIDQLKTTAIKGEPSYKYDDEVKLQRYEEVVKNLQAKKGPILQALVSSINTVEELRKVVASDKGGIFGHVLLSNTVLRDRLLSKEKKAEEKIVTKQTEPAAHDKAAEIWTVTTGK